MTNVLMLHSGAARKVELVGEESPELSATTAIRDFGVFVKGHDCSSSRRRRANLSAHLHTLTKIDLCGTEHGELLCALIFVNRSAWHFKQVILF